MENYDFNEIKVSLTKTDKLEYLLDMYLVEANILNCDIDDGWIQIQSIDGENCNVYFLHEINGEKARFLKELGIKIPASFKISDRKGEMPAEPNVFEIGFKKSKNNIKKAAVFIAEIFRKLFYVNEIKSFSIEFNGIFDPNDRLFDSEFYIDEFREAGIDFIEDAEFSSEEIVALHRAFDSYVFIDLLESANNLPHPYWLNQYDIRFRDLVDNESLRRNSNKLLVDHAVLILSFINSLPVFLKNKIDIDDGLVSKAIKGAYSSWQIQLCNELLSLLENTFGSKYVVSARLGGLLDKIKFLDDVLLLVKNKPGISRKEIYKELEVNGQQHGNSISNVLVKNELLEEVVEAYDRLLYLGNQGQALFYSIE